MNKETFCALPFTGLFLGPDGIVKTCCSARDGIGDLKTTPIHVILNSKKAISIRQAIINGEWHSNCSQCQGQEKQGARSERQGDINEYLDHQVFDFKLKRLDVRWSNTCNLTCTYCYEYFSSKWANIKGIKVNAIQDENEESLFLLVQQSIDSIENVIMLGGEPLLQKQNKRLVEMLKGKQIYILSNLAVPLKTNPIAQLLIEDDQCHWGASLETVGERYEYVRHGASWQLLLENIDYLRERNKSLNLHSLYSIYSAFNLVEYYDFVLSKGIKEIHWNLHQSNGDDTPMNIMNLPDEFKIQAIREIEKCETQFPNAPGIDQLVVFKEEMINRLNANKSKIIAAVEVSEKAWNDGSKTFAELWPEVYDKLQSRN